MLLLTADICIYFLPLWSDLSPCDQRGDESPTCFAMRRAEDEMAYHWWTVP